MQSNHTKILSLATLVMLIITLWSWSRFSDHKTGAQGAAKDMKMIRQQLTGIVAARGGSGQSAVATIEPNEILRRLNNAAVNAGVKDHLVLSDPGNPSRLGNSDLSEYPFSLRFVNINLQQLTGFFQQVTANDASSRARSIELSSPEQALIIDTSNNPVPKGTGEVWTADVSISYLMLSAREIDKIRKPKADE